MRLTQREREWRDARLAVRQKNREVEQARFAAELLQSLQNPDIPIRPLVLAAMQALGRIRDAADIDAELATVIQEKRDEAQAARNARPPLSDVLRQKESEIENAPD